METMAQHKSPFDFKIEYCGEVFEAYFSEPNISKADVAVRFGISEELVIGCIARWKQHRKVVSRNPLQPQLVGMEGF